LTNREKGSRSRATTEKGGIIMRNMGVVDRVVRSIAGLALVICGVLLLFGAWQIVAIVVGAILLLTAMVGICPLYMPFSISTKK